ncbi:MAG: 50S ribosomal protein L10 [Patescibacteria group bacterium]|nr:50S ribosomal protein L10 [Patescibacteria group bacterium]
MDNTKISKNKEKKAQIVAEVAQKVDKSKILIFTNYQGMTHQQIEELKKSLKKTDAEYAITKNTLLARSFKEPNDSVSALSGPTGTIFGYADPIAPLKELVKIIKKLKLPLIKFGIFSAKDGSASGREGWKLLSENDIIQMSSLPPKEVLLAKLFGSMKSPISNLVFVLNGNIQKLVITLKAIEIKKNS